MKNKIIVITTGGTIGSVLQSGTFSVEKSAHYISKEIERVNEQLDYDIEILSPLNKNSESFQPTDWVSILNCLSEINNSDADGIVITHGTDTMAYTVAALASYNKLWNKRICFTGAFYSPQHPDSDASFNLISAFSVAANAQLKNGVYVVFRSNNSNIEACILRGYDTKPMDFDDQYFRATYANAFSLSIQNLASVSDIPGSAAHPGFSDLNIPTESAITKSQQHIACISLYPGINKALLERISSGCRLLVVQLYHSGTGPVEHDYSDLIDFISENKDNITILMGTFPGQYIERMYDSTKELISAGGHIYADLQQHTLYTYSLLALSIGLSSNDILHQLSKWEVR